MIIAGGEGDFVKGAFVRAIIGRNDHAHIRKELQRRAIQVLISVNLITGGDLSGFYILTPDSPKTVFNVHLSL